MRGRLSTPRKPDATRPQALAGGRAHDTDFAPPLAAAMLAKHHALPLAPETLRRWRIADGHWPRHRRRRPHRHRRERQTHAGALGQIDGSHHDWLAGRAPQCVLLGLVAAATHRSLRLRPGQARRPLRRGRGYPRRRRCLRAAPPTAPGGRKRSIRIRTASVQSTPPRAPRARRARCRRWGGRGKRWACGGRVPLRRQPKGAGRTPPSSVSRSAGQSTAPGRERHRGGGQRLLGAARPARLERARHRDRRFRDRPASEAAARGAAGRRALLGRNAGGGAGLDTALAGESLAARPAPRGAVAGRPAGGRAGVVGWPAADYAARRETGVAGTGRAPGRAGEAGRDRGPAGGRACDAEALRLVTRGGGGGWRPVRPRAAPVRPRPPPTVLRSSQARLRTRLVKAGDWEIGAPGGRARTSGGEPRSTWVAVAGAAGGAAKPAGTFSLR